MSNMTSFAVLALVLASTESFIPLQAPSFCPADRNEPWTYRGDNGPEHWGETYEQCNGQNQSPIALKTSDAVKDENLAQLALNNYDTPLTEAALKNNGHSIEVEPGDGVERTISVNGDTYRLHQFHFHWGYFFFQGSEHTLDGRQYAMELHFVHLNEAGEIAVVGIFLQERLTPNAALQPIVNQLSKLMYKGTETELASPLNLNQLLPSNPTSFFRYEGSLTTPECDEGVTWSVVPQPIPVGTLQMAQFRRLFSATAENATVACRLAGNYRPLQPLNDRQVFLSQ